MVADCDLGGSGTDPTANVGFIQNLLSQKSKALHFLLINKDFFLPALKKGGNIVTVGIYASILTQIFKTQDKPVCHSANVKQECPNQPKLTVP